MSAAAPTTPRFKQNAREALADPNLQAAMGGAQSGFVAKRATARAKLPEFDALRDAARDLKDHVLANLDLYLERYEAKVIAAGGQLHWAETAEDARRIVLEICQKAGAKTVNKGKSMIAEECGINDHLEEHGIHPQETDLGEYIIQLRGEMPSHIIAPAVHVTVAQVEAEFRKAHTHLDPDRNLSEISDLLAEAREVLREKYFQAQVGITGANLLIAETGQSVIVHNEGNGDPPPSPPRGHIVRASLGKSGPALGAPPTHPRGSRGGRPPPRVPAPSGGAGGSPRRRRGSAHRGRPRQRAAGAARTIAGPRPGPRSCRGRRSGRSRGRAA